MNTEITITTENTTRETRLTQAQADNWAAKGMTPYSPITNEPAKVGDVMSRTPAVRISVVHPDGSILISRTVRRHPMTAQQTEDQLVNQVLSEREDLTYGGLDWFGRAAAKQAAHTATVARRVAELSPEERDAALAEIADHTGDEVVAEYGKIAAGDDADIDRLFAAPPTAEEYASLLTRRSQQSILRAIMHRYSLTGSHVAELVGVDSRTVRRWLAPADQDGHRAMPYAAMICLVHNLATR